MTHDVLRIALAMMAETPWSRMLAPLLVAVPVVTLVNVLRERAFAKKWGARVLDGAEALGFGAKNVQSQESAA